MLGAVALESGTAPWAKPWSTEDLNGVQNAISGKPYRDINAVALMCGWLLKCYKDPRWATYRQAQEQGWQVRKGEKARKIMFYCEERDEETTKRETFVKWYSVFNIEQMDGTIPEYVRKTRTVADVCAAGEKIVKRSGAKIVHWDQDLVSYTPSTDTIHMPHRKYFATTAGYYETFIHELAHWTGHRSRLGQRTHFILEPGV